MKVTLKRTIRRVINKSLWRIQGEPSHAEWEGWVSCPLDWERINQENLYEPASLMLVDLLTETERIIDIGVGGGKTYLIAKQVRGKVLSQYLWSRHFTIPY